MTALYLTGYVAALICCALSVRAEHWGRVILFLVAMIVLGLCAGGSLGGANG